MEINYLSSVNQLYFYIRRSVIFLTYNFKFLFMFVFKLGSEEEFIIKNLNFENMRKKFRTFKSNVCVCACVCACVCVRTRTRAHVCVCLCARARTYACMSFTEA